MKENLENLIPRLVNEFGLQQIKFDSATCFRFQFREKTNYIKISDLNRAIKPLGLTVYGVDPDQCYFDVLAIDHTRCKECWTIIPESTEDYHGHANSGYCYDCYQEMKKIVEAFHSIVAKEIST